MHTGQDTSSSQASQLGSVAVYSHPESGGRARIDSLHCAYALLA